MAPLGNYTVAEVRVKDLQAALRTLDSASKIIQNIIFVSTGRVIIVSHD